MFYLLGDSIILFPSLLFVIFSMCKIMFAVLVSFEINTKLPIIYVLSRIL